MTRFIRPGSCPRHRHRCLALASGAHAAVEIDVTQGNVQPLPIALPNFQSRDALGAKLIEVVAADLKRSGLFAPINRPPSSRRT